MRCKRFRQDGSACANETDQADGWCRRPECPGFLRSNPDISPINFGGPQGTSRHIRETGDVAVPGVTVEDVQTVFVTTHALDSFRFHHGGDATQAEVQLREMLEDFLVKSARRISSDGRISLARDGYKLVLSPAGDAIIGYSTVHRERTWQQLKSGVESRFKRKRVQRTYTGPPEGSGPAKALPDFWSAFSADAIRITNRVRRDYKKIAGNPMVSADNLLDDEIRARCREFARGSVSQRADGFFLVSIDNKLRWLISPDCGSLVGVRRSRPGEDAEAATHAD